MKTKSAITKAKKKKVERAKPAKIKNWSLKDMAKMSEIIMAAPDQVLGQKLAAEYFGTTYASIQCRWSRYKRGMNMGRANKKAKKVTKTTVTHSKTYTKPVTLPKISEMTTSSVIGKEILDMITIKSMEIHKNQRTIIIHY